MFAGIGVAAVAAGAGAMGPSLASTWPMPRLDSHLYAQFSGVSKEIFALCVKDQSIVRFFRTRADLNAYIKMSTRRPKRAELSK